MSDKATAVIAAAIACFLGIFFTRYMVSGHTELLVEILIAQFIGNGLLAAILVTLLIR
jgi:Na+-transporting NADH:ubiquinone oxidoreductase subunit NqrB